jgi:hypothetical protein
MKITGTRNYIDVDFGEKSVRIEGELTTVPSFYVSINSIKYWKTPKGMTQISEDDRNWIISEIIRHNNPKFEIIFED